MPARKTSRFLQHLLLCGLLAAALPAYAETVFIIDQVEAGLHESREASSPILKLLPTGTELEVVARDGTRVQVRDSTGTVGWIDARFLMPDKPTRQLLNEAEAELERTRAELRQLREQRSETDAKATPAELQRLKQARDGLQKELAAERDQVAALRARISELENRSTQQAHSPAGGGMQGLVSILEQPRYLAAAIVVLLLLGVLAGAWLVDYLNRRRHGGFRI